MTIRKFESRDAEAVSELIAENLKTVNVKDYSEELMEALASFKNPEQCLQSAEKHDAFVAVEGDKVLGIAMLYKNKIRSMFVLKQMQGRGIGRELIAHIENLARSRKLSRLALDSSITAVGFYIKCGYRVVRKTNKPFRHIDNIVFEMVKIL